MGQQFNATIKAELNRSVPLTREEEKTATPEQLILGNLRYLSNVTSEFASYGNINELYSEGKYGLCVAAQRFDPKMNNKFISYAKWWIRQAIMGFLKNNSTVRVPESVVNNIQKIGKYYDSDQEALDDKAITESEYQKVQKARGIKGVMSLDYQRTRDTSYHEIIPDKKPSILEKLEEESIEKAVKEYLRILTEKERDIVCMYFGIGSDETMTLEEISLRYNVSRQAIQQRLKVVMGKLQERLRGLSTP